MHVWGWIVIIMSVYSVVSEEVSCPVCIMKECEGHQNAAAKVETCYYRVRGRWFAVYLEFKQDRYRLACDYATLIEKVQPLDDEALPRLPQVTRMPTLDIDGCRLPTSSSVSDALAALNISVVDELVLTRIPSFVELYENVFDGLDVQRLTLIVEGQKRRAPAGLLHPRRPLHRLTKLEITNVALDTDALFNLPVSLESLTLNYCNLTAIPPEALIRLYNLTSLTLHEPLLTIPPALSLAPALTTLDLSAPLSTSPPLHTLTDAKLTYLYYTDKIPDVQLPGGCGQLQQVQLIVKHQGLEKLLANWLQSDGKDCPYLQELRIHAKNLRFVEPRALAGAGHLTKLTMKNCKLLTMLPDDLLLPLSKLETLDLGSNSLTNISDSLLAPLEALRHLNLSDNRLTAKAIRALGALTPLTHLYLSDNPLGDLCHRRKNTLSTLSRLKSLRVLSLSNTGQQRVCGDWRQLGQLEILQLLKNDIHMLRDEDFTWRRQDNSAVTVELCDNGCNVVLSQRGYSKLRNATTHIITSKFQFDFMRHCDCHHYWLARAVREKIFPTQMTRMWCWLDGHGSSFVYLEQAEKHMVCKGYSKCPAGCHCIWRPHDETLEANCGNQSSLLVFDDVEVATRRLSLAHNKLQSVAALLPAMAARNITLLLADNPLHCNCTELTVLQQYSDKIEDYENVTCSDGRPVKSLLLVVQCDETGGLLALAVLAGAVLLLARALAVAWKRTQYAVKHYLLKRRNKLLRKEHYLYDGFLAFSYHDAKFADDVLSTLERYGLRLCVHWRDWPVGCWLPHAVQHSICNSRRTVALLSTAFGRGVWTRLELRKAVDRSTTGLGARPVVILLEGRVPRGLRRLARSAHRLQRDDPRLIAKLRALLGSPPPPPRLTATVTAIFTGIVTVGGVTARQCGLNCALCSRSRPEEIELNQNGAIASLDCHSHCHSSPSLPYPPSLPQSLPYPPLTAIALPHCDSHRPSPPSLPQSLP